MDEREATIRAMLPMVRRIARRIKRMVPAFDLDDLIGDGSVGLIRAVDCYDASRGSLGRYARRLIVGAMLNGVRRMDPVSERSRRIVRAVENERFALAAERGDLPGDAEMGRRWPSYSRAAAAARSGQPLSLDAPLPDGESLECDWSGDPAAIVERRRARAELDAAIARLPGRQRNVLLLHYYGERSLRSIARALSISAQRTSQLHRSAIARLKAGALAQAG